MSAELKKILSHSVVCGFQTQSQPAPKWQIKHRRGGRERCWLSPSAYIAEDPASTGVSRPSDGLPANRPEGEDGSSRDRTHWRGCHTPHAYSLFLLLFAFADNYQNNHAEVQKFILISLLAVELRREQTCGACIQTQEWMRRGSHSLLTRTVRCLL